MRVTNLKLFVPQNDNLAITAVKQKKERYEAIVLEWSRIAVSQKINVSSQIDNIECLKSSKSLETEAFFLAFELRCKTLIKRILEEQFIDATKRAKTWWRIVSDRSHIDAYKAKLLFEVSNMSKVNDFENFLEKARWLSKEAQRISQLGVFSNW